MLKFKLFYPTSILVILLVTVAGLVSAQENDHLYVHPGIDIRPSGDETNTDLVYSTHSGFVTYAGPAPLALAEKGWLVQIETDLNRDNVADIITRYTHLVPESMLFINDFKYKRKNYTPEYFVTLEGEGVDKLPYGYGPYVARQQLIGMVGATGTYGHQHIQYEIVTNRFMDTFGAGLDTFSCNDDPYIEACSEDPTRPGFFFPNNKRVGGQDGNMVVSPLYVNSGLVTPPPPEPALTF